MQRPPDCGPDPLRHGVDPGVDRRQRRLVVLDRLWPTIGQRDDPPHHPRGDALERRHREVQVRVVAVGRVHVRAQPDAGIDDADVVGREPARELRQRLAVVHADLGLELERPR